MSTPEAARPHRRRAATVALAALLALAGPTAAQAAPAPDRGPTAGGTRVAGPTPERTELALVPTDGGGLGHHTVLLDADGAAVAWGSNTSGQLGDGTTTTSSRPVRVLAPAGVTFTRVSVSDAHTVATGSDGATYAWGGNAYGQLGDGTTTRSTTPALVQAPAGVTFVSVEAGAGFTVATAADGTAYAWGRNSSGQLGNGTTTDAASPVAVSMPAGVTFHGVSVGTSVTVALGSDGEAYAWGFSSSGQLGSGSTTRSTVPVRVQAPAGVTFSRVVAGSAHVLGVTADGSAYAWGNNSLGKLGDGSATNRTRPVPVLAPAGVGFVDVAAGIHHTVAIGTDGLTYAWGNRSLGQLGDGGTTGLTSTPVLVQVPPGTTFTNVLAGMNHTVAQGSDGITYTWGTNDLGQIGHATLPLSAVPVALRPEPLVTEVTFGGVAGTDLHQDAAGWTVDTPPGLCGAVDVAVTSVLVDATTTMLPGAFTAGTAPVITRQPTASQLVAAATGDPVPTVRWQQLVAGSGWTDVVGATSEHLDVPVAAGTTVRAVVTSCAGTAASDTVTLAAPAEVEPDVEAAGGPEPEPRTDRESPSETATDRAAHPGALATTGVPATVWVLGSLALVLTGALLLRVRRPGRADV
jgi:alpha-tubulin suppressor-like RCC1 family protein